MLFDIPITLKVEATNELLAEEQVRNALKQEMAKPALERAIKSWEFTEFITEEEYKTRKFLGI